MANYISKAAQQIAESAADVHKVLVQNVLQLFEYREDEHSRYLTFAAVMYMLLSDEHRPKVLAYLNKESKTIATEFNLIHDERILHRYKFLYQMLDLAKRGTETFQGLSFYPRLEDLFHEKQSKETPVTTFLVNEAKQPESDEPNAPWEEPKAKPKREPLQDKGRTFKWNKQQKDALAKVHAWLRTKNRPPVFRLFGFAGTGKTELSKAIADFAYEEEGKQNVPKGGVLFAAYTGKACSVMRSKGCRGADTLHALLYRPRMNPITGKIDGFVLNGESPLATCGLLIIDEVSMVNEEMAEDILSFGCPVLVLGDPGQLRPVQGEGWFINAEPDVMLTDVRRQAKDNPIILLATTVREGGILKPGHYGDSVVYAEGTHKSDEMFADHDQVLCGLNATRKSVNRRVRRINGKADIDPIYPVPGDRLMCLRNNKVMGLYNGTMWTSSKVSVKPVRIVDRNGLARNGDLDVLSFKVRSLDEKGPDGEPFVVKTQCSMHMFNDRIAEPEFRLIASCDQYDYGYGASVHKGQGSQWSSILLIDESSVFRDQCSNHAYTGITRAADRISICL